MVADEKVSADEAKMRSVGRLRRILARKMADPPGQTWREIDDKNNFGPAFFRAAIGKTQ